MGDGWLQQLNVRRLPEHIFFSEGKQTSKMVKIPDFWPKATRWEYKSASSLQYYNEPPGPAVYINIHDCE